MLFLGFSGCLSDILANGDELPFLGSTERFDIEVKGEVGNSCEDSGTDSASLHVAVIVIIVFFSIVFILIVVVFVVLRWRRRQKKEERDKMTNNTNGYLPTSNTSTTSINKGLTDESQSSDDYRLRKIENEKLANGIYEEREVVERPMGSLSLQPDIISAEAASSGHLSEGLIDEGSNHYRRQYLGQDNHGYPHEQYEQYDLDNASSMVQSDTDDIVGHYKNFRKINKYPIRPIGNVQPPNHRHPHRRTSPSPIIPLDPLTQRQLMTKSPIHNTSSPLTIQNHSHFPRRSPPVVQQMRPASALPPGVRDMRASPLNIHSMRSTPVGGLYTPGSNASNSSTGHIERPTSVPVGCVAGRPPHNGRMKMGSQFLPNHRINHGLSVDEIRLHNHRTTSPVSTLDAVSSSSDGRHMNNRPTRGTGVGASHHHHYPSRLGLGLDNPDSSSDEAGSNDSFTCSEFEYEPERSRVPSKPRFGHLAQVAENDLEIEPRSLSRAAGDGSDSNRDGSLSTFPTSDEDQQQQHRQHLLQRPQSAASRLLNGTALNWDYLLNWGPNFEKLVGVFNDIAELPDSQSASTLRVSSPRTTSVSPKQAKSPTHSVDYESSVREEYV